MVPSTMAAPSWKGFDLTRRGFPKIRGQKRKVFCREATRLAERLEGVPGAQWLDAILKEVEENELHLRICPERGALHRRVVSCRSAQLGGFLKGLVRKYVELYRREWGLSAALAFSFIGYVGRTLTGGTDTSDAWLSVVEGEDVDTSRHLGNTYGLALLYEVERYVGRRNDVSARRRNMGASETSLGDATRRSRLRRKRDGDTASSNALTSSGASLSDVPTSSNGPMSNDASTRGATTSSCVTTSSDAPPSCVITSNNTITSGNVITSCDAPPSNVITSSDAPPSNVTTSSDAPPNELPRSSDASLNKAPTSNNVTTSRSSPTTSVRRLTPRRRKSTRSGRILKRKVLLDL